jgi:hypothetical protein
MEVYEAESRRESGLQKSSLESTACRWQLELRTPGLEGSLLTRELR